MNYLSQLKRIELYGEELVQIIIFGVFLVLVYYLISLFIKYSIKVTTSLKYGKKDYYFDRALTISRAIRSIFRYVLLFVFIVFILNKFNINLTVILTSAGFVGATIVLVFQNTLRDVLSGWLFFFEDLFREGEQVMINNVFSGKIIDFKSRFLVLKGEKGEIINVPYSQINIVHNFSRKRNTARLIAKFRREIFNENFIVDLENMIKNEFADNTTLEILINKNFNLAENIFEVFITFKSTFALKEEMSQKLKLLLIRKFGDDLIEIKDEG
ncbi:MAG: mechanosensitive ion channel [Patescibacteria group bacterium]|nr:mechanosensitive ion channel [Patescibacteria group bacterium]